MTYEIATDLPKAGFDFYAGAGFVKPEKKDSVNIYTLFDRAGYTIARGNDDFRKKAAKADKIIFMQEQGCDMGSCLMPSTGNRGICHLKRLRRERSIF